MNTRFIETDHRAARVLDGVTARFLPRLLLLAVYCATLLHADRRKPNFVVILADDLGYGDLGVQGHPKIRTPEIDRMAREGVRLTEFYSPAPTCTPARVGMLTGRYPYRSGLVRVLIPKEKWGLPQSEITLAEALRENGYATALFGKWPPAPTCTPARVGMLTGRYPYRSGLVRVLIPKEKWGLPQSEITLAEALRENGYATALFGKWHLGGRKPFRPLKHGFDSFFGLLYSNDMGLLPLLKWPRLELLRGDKPVESPAKVKTLTRRYTEEAVRYIEQNRERPFFLFLSHTMPHLPLRPADEFRGKSNFGYYGDVVEELDWSTGRVLRALKDNGLDENTLVIFTSDNGPWTKGGDGRLQTRGTANPLRGVKGTTWEGGMRVPFIARMPGRLPAGQVREGVASLMDLFTTFIEEAGGEIPSDRAIDGKNIMAMLAGRADSPHSEFFYYFRRKLFAIRAGRWKLHLFQRKVGGKGKPGDPVRLRPPRLYDLSEDSAEQHDVAVSNSEVVRALAARGQAFHADIRPVLNLPGPGKSVLGGLITQAPKSQK